MVFPRLLPCLCICMMQKREKNRRFLSGVLLTSLNVPDLIELSELSEFISYWECISSYTPLHVAWCKINVVTEDFCQVFFRQALMPLSWLNYQNYQNFSLIENWNTSYSAKCQRINLNLIMFDEIIANFGDVLSNVSLW